MEPPRRCGGNAAAVTREETAAAATLRAWRDAAAQRGEPLTDAQLAKLVRGGFFSCFRIFHAQRPFTQIHSPDNPSNIKNARPRSPRSSSSARRPSSQPLDRRRRRPSLSPPSSSSPPPRRRRRSRSGSRRCKASSRRWVTTTRPSPLTATRSASRGPSLRSWTPPGGRWRRRCR